MINTRYHNFDHCSFVFTSVIVMSDSEAELQLYMPGDPGEQPSSDFQVEQPHIFSVPLPRQTTYDGTSNWQGFILPYMSLASTCGWAEEEKLFRLCSSLRGEAADYVFVQLTPEVVNSFELLKLALHSRFAEKRTTTSYLAQLEARKLKPQDKLSEYVADIRSLVIKGYPTADDATRETIGLRHFIKGLPDLKTAVAVGMEDPQSLEAARTTLDTYTSLREETTKPSRLGAMQVVPNGEMLVTESRLQEFGEEMKSSIKRMFKDMKSLVMDTLKRGSYDMDSDTDASESEND